MAAPIGGTHSWIVVANWLIYVGECESVIVKNCTKAAHAEEVASHIRMKAALSMCTQRPAGRELPGKDNNAIL